MTALQILTAVNAILDVAASAGVNIRKLMALRELNGGSLSREQVAELAQEARESVEKL